MTRVLLTLQLLALFSVVTFAQQPNYEYGKPSELRGVTKVFVDTGPDSPARDAILKELRKRCPLLIVAESPDNAEVFLVFSRRSETTLTGVRTRDVPGTTIKRSTPEYDDVKRGTGYVAKYPAAGRVRILMSFEGAQDHLFAREPAVSFARAFCKAYTEANRGQTEVR